MNDQEREELEFTYSTPAEVDRYDAELGAYNRNDTTSRWILSNRDVWYRNPFYSGPPYVCSVPGCDCDGYPESQCREYGE